MSRGKKLSYGMAINEALHQIMVSRNKGMGD